MRHLHILLLFISALVFSSCGGQKHPEDRTLVPFANGGKWGFCNSFKEVVIPAQYDNAVPFNEGMARVKRGDKFGFIDTSGKEVIPCIYQDAYFYFTEGIVPVTREDIRDQNWVYIDKTGKVVSDRFKSAYPLAEGLGPVYVDTTYGFVDKTGKLAVRTRCNSSSAFCEGFAQSQIDGVECFIDRTGKIVIGPDPTVIYFGHFHEGLATVYKNAGTETHNKNMHGYIDTTGKQVIGLEYLSAGDFAEGLAPVSQNGKWGFINHQNKVVIPLQYDHTSSFSEGLAEIQTDKGVGFIDKTGKVVIPCKYTGANSFEHGYALVAVSALTSFYIDKKGTEYR